MSEEISSGKTVIDEHGNIHIDISIESHQVSEDEMNYYSHCVSIADKAGKRFDKHPNKYITYSQKDDYTLCFQNLCEITIDKNTEYLGSRIREKE